MAASTNRMVLAIFCVLFLHGTAFVECASIVDTLTQAVSDSPFGEPYSSEPTPPGDWTGPTEPPACVDKNTFCSSWASAGECDKNPGYMLFNCQRSCESCGFEKTVGSGTCADHHEQCAAWAIVGECQANPAYMLTSCPHACDNCLPEETFSATSWE